MSSSNWSQKLFGCTNDIETCCCGAFCGPCLMCRNAGYLDKSGFLCCFLGVLLPCIPFFLLRGATREKYNIEGSVCEDAATAVFCGSCVNCQIDAEIKARGDYK
eukprot:02135.XXX_6995_6568_1 [CDS] Oithona nana genome sequencing.